MLDLKNYNNPLSVQAEILKKIEDGFNGEKVIVDPNNSYCTLIESFSEVISDSISAIENKFYSLYPKRAIDSYDLYNHISDFEYIGIFSLPASTNIELILHKDYLIENALPYVLENGTETNYNLVEIPANTVFSIGNYNFKLYYPIHIQINKTTDSITVIYDTSSINPLHSLNSSNIVKKEYNFNGLDLLSISFPIYQFEKTLIEEIPQPEFGFRKQYEYTDKFYAVRIFNYINDEYEEMNYTMSNVSYDPDKPTASLKVYPETNIIEISIPQIYFTNEMIGSKLRIELLTTHGALNVSIDNVNIENMLANFNLTEKDTNVKYSKILKNIPYIQIIPLNTGIVGGSDGYSFDELKQRIIYGSKDEVVPITNNDIDFLFKNNGFQLQKKIDNLTDRIYYAHKKIANDTEEFLVLNIRIKISKEMIATYYNDDGILVDVLDNYSSILRHKNSIAVLSNAIYKYDPENNLSAILKDTEASFVEPNGEGNINIKELNETIYLKSPYCLSICTKDTYPVANSYDLYSCSINNINYKGENKTISMQANVIDASIIHYLVKKDKDPTDPNSNKVSQGGFKLYIEVLKSADLLTISDYVDENEPDSNPNFIVHLSMPVSGSSYRIGMDGYLDADLSSDTSKVYCFDIDSNFIFDNDTISLTNMNSATDDTVHIVNLLTTAVISFHIKKSLVPSNGNIEDDSDISTYLLNNALPTEISYNPSNYFGIACQEIDITFGKFLNEQVYNNLTVTYSPQVKALWDHDVKAVYTQDIYKKDSTGKLVYTISNGEVVLNKLYSIGEEVLDNNNNVVYLHKKNDPKLDENNNYIIERRRAIEYAIDLFAFDIRYFHEDSEFDVNITEVLNNYFTTLTNIQENILENTKAYFRPLDRIGNHIFNTSNIETILLPLSLLFKMVCYITTKTYNNTDLHTVITNKIIDIIKESLSNTLISFVDIGNTIKENLGDLITNIDIDGIDGYTSLQTLINTSTNKTPSIRKELIQLDNNVLQFNDIIDITFKKLD